MNEVMRIDQQSCSPQTSASPAIAEDSGASPAGPMVFTVGQGSAPVLKLVSPMEGGAPQLIKVVPAVVSTADGAHHDGKVSQGTLMVQKVEDGQQTEVVSQRVYSIVQKPTQTLSNISPSSPVASAVKNTFNNGQQRVHTLSSLPPTTRVISANTTAVVPQKVHVISNVVLPTKLNPGGNKFPLQAQRQIITTPLAQKQLNNNTSKQPVAKPLQPQIQTQQPQPKIPTINSLVLTTSQPKPLVSNSVQQPKTLKSIGGNLSRPQVVQPQKTIKTLSPQSPQTGYAPKTSGIKTLSPQMNHFNKQLQSPINKMPNQRFGIKTLAPQKPGSNNNNNRNNSIAQKPNYIGKHANQAQKSQKNNMQMKNRNLTQRLAGSLSPTKYNNQKSSVGTTQSNFNQSLTAQILQSLPSSGSRNTTEISYGSMKNYPMQSPPDDTSLSEDIGEEVKPDFSPNLSYLYQLVMLDHNYGAPPPALSPPSILSRSSGAHVSPGASSALNGALNASRERENIAISQKRSQRLNSLTAAANLGPGGNQSHEDDAQSTISSEGGNAEDGDEGEETETAPEGEGDEDGITRCICDFVHDDGYMICCDVCSSWQHVDCMGLDRDHIPDKYSCVRCQPRRVDRQHARAIQQRKREEFARLGSVVVSTNVVSSGGVPSGTLVGDRGSGSGNQSDTSSESSTESDRDRHSVSLNNNVTKKRSAPVSVAGRRKSEPVRRAPLTHKRQRRESAAAASASAANRRAALKKREKKQVIKRKMKSRSSLDESSQDSWPSNYPNMGTSLLQLRQWIENYEEAVTNHYSPELRARISNMRANGQHQNDNKEKVIEKDVKQAPSTAAQDVQMQKCRLGNQPLTGIKIVLAAQSLAPNTPVIELRGKYMLSTQHRAAGGGNSGALLTRAHSQRPGPFLFFYRLPRDGTEVCVDTRTYGNDARFIRRSCRPNAELRHLVEKGTLHLYIITTSPVDKNCELTLRHESHDLAAIAAASTGPTLHSTASTIPCACGGAPSTCLLYSHRSNGLEQTTDEVEIPRKRRGRRASSPRRGTPPTSPPMSPTRTEKVPEKEVVIKEIEKEKENEKMVTRRSSGHRTSTVGFIEEKSKEGKEKEVKEVKERDKEEVTSKEAKDKKKKLTREERKMEAIMKAFERLEKEDKRKQEVQARQAQRRDADPHSGPPQNPPSSNTGLNLKQENADSEREIVRTRRKKRKGRARTVSTNSQSSTRRRTRLNSTDSYMTSGDESLLSPPLPSTNTILTTNHPASSPTKSIPAEEDLHDDLASPIREKIDKIDKLASSGSQTSEMSSPGQVNTAAGLLLALANGGASQNVQTIPQGPSSEGQSIQEDKNENDSSGCNSLTSSPGTPLSSACLLVAAAVGPLEPGFKFPKTKKAIMNEWLNKSPDQPPDDFPPSLSSITPQSQQFQSFDLYSSTKNLATLVQAASLCDSPQSYPPGTKSVNSGSAKKRWLRQAISEECDSPCRPEEEAGNQEPPVAPPKKRRLARESLSSEEKFTPPTTPTGLVPPNHSLDDENFPNNDEEFYETQQNTLSDSSPPAIEENTKRVVISSGVGPNFHHEIDSDIKEQVNLGPSLLDSRLGRDPRPVFRDSAQLLGTLEKTIRFYEESLAGPVNPSISVPQPHEPPASPIIAQIDPPKSKSPEIFIQPTIDLKISSPNLSEETTVLSPITSTVAPLTPIVTTIVPVTSLVTTILPVTPMITTAVPVTPMVTTVVPVTPMITTVVPEAPMVTTVVPEAPMITTVVPVTPVVPVVPVVPMVTTVVPVAPKVTAVVPVKPIVTTVMTTATSATPKIKEKLTVHPKPELITPAKRKLSISEYRQRKQQRVSGRNLSPTPDRAVSPETPPKAPSPAITSVTSTLTQIISKPCLRSRSVSTSSTTSSLSSDEDLIGTEKSDSGGEKENKIITGVAEPQVLVAFSSAPTAVELQRENVERLKKAFGLAIDDETRRLANPIIREKISPILPLSTEKTADITNTITPTMTSNTVSKFSLLDTKYSPKVRVEKSITPISSPKQEIEIEAIDPKVEPEGTQLDPFAKLEESTSFIPPFNNPVYPNSTQFTSFSSVIDSSPYEGRNPSPPPSELLKSNKLLMSPSTGFK